MARAVPEPFSGKNFRNNADRCQGSETACALCGKAVLHPWPFSVRVIDGGDAWAALDAPDDGDGEMGVWPVGSDCAKRLIAAGVPVHKGQPF